MLQIYTWPPFFSSNGVGGKHTGSRPAKHSSKWFNLKHVIASGIAHVLKDNHMLPRCAVQGLGRGTPPWRVPQTHPPCRLTGGQPGAQRLLITPFLPSLPACGTAEGDTEPARVAEGLRPQQRHDTGEDEPPHAQLGSPANLQPSTRARSQPR